MIDLRSLATKWILRICRTFKEHTVSGSSERLRTGWRLVNERWSESIAVGSLSFVEKVKISLASKPHIASMIEVQGSYVLREPAAAYAGKFVGEKAALSSENALVWDETVEDARDIAWSDPDC